MVVQKNEKQMELIKSDNTLKMTIPANVEQKIRFACAFCPDKEWSGVLFYQYKGGFEDNKLHITCKDILVMDVGNASYTEWCADAEVISYMAENDLLDCQLGIIHSHNSMNAFFSGTDLSTLQQEGKDRNNIVSLIVNNKGQYEAAVTRKLHTESTVQETGTYEFFGEGSKEYADLYVIEDTYIEYFMCNIIKKEPKGLLAFANRMKELLTKKVYTLASHYSEYPHWAPFTKAPQSFKSWESVKTPTQVPSTVESCKIQTEADHPNTPEKEPVQKTPLFIADNESSLIEYTDDNLVTDELVDGLVAQLLTGNVLNMDAKFDINTWVTTKMMEAFTKRFGTDTSVKSDFTAWEEQFIEFLIYNSHDEILDFYSSGEQGEILAEAMYKRLQKLPVQNLFTKAIMAKLEYYYE